MTVRLTIPHDRHPRRRFWADLPEQALIGFLGLCLLGLAFIAGYIFLLAK